MENRSGVQVQGSDHNGYVGAARSDMRQCMGELITDEEVDMMIKMVDSDGDGQVSTEFYNVYDRTSATD